MVVVFVVVFVLCVVVLSGHRNSSYVNKYWNITLG